MRKVFISVLALAALASCTQNDGLEQTTDNGKVEVKLTSAVTDIEVGTRAPLTVGAALEANVLLSKVSGDYYTATNLLHNGTMTFTTAGTAVSFAEKQYYPAGMDGVFLCGLYPAATWKVGMDAATTAEYTFDGKTDVMAAAEKASAKKDGQDGGTPQVLEFKHLLTNVIVKAVVDTKDGGTAESVQKVWGAIKTITLSEAGGSTSLKNKVTVNLKAGTATAFAGSTAPLFYGASGTGTPYTYTDNQFSATPVVIPTPTATAIAYSMVAPITINTTAGQSEFKLKITTEKQTDPRELTIDLTRDLDVSTDDMQGRQCVITLSFKAKEIKASATVEAWKAGGKADVPVL